MTSAFQWSLRSQRELAGVHPDLLQVCNLALERSQVDFIVIDGRRTREEQLKHYKAGASKILKSRHLHGFAVDVAALVDGKVRWEGVYYKPIGQAFKAAAKQLGVPIKWGGDWKWKDWGHFELDKKEYPDP